MTRPAHPTKIVGIVKGYKVQTKNYAKVILNSRNFSDCCREAATALNGMAAFRIGEDCPKDNLRTSLDGLYRFLAKNCSEAVNRDLMHELMSDIKFECVGILDGHFIVGFEYEGDGLPKVSYRIEICHALAPYRERWLQPYLDQGGDKRAPAVQGWDIV